MLFLFWRGTQATIASMSPPAAQPGLRISNDLRIDHEKAYLQLRSLDLRASVCNQVFNGSLFTLHRCCSAAAMRAVTLVRSLKIGIINVGYRSLQSSSATLFLSHLDKLYSSISPADT